MSTHDLDLCTRLRDIGGNILVHYADGARAVVTIDPKGTDMALQHHDEAGHSRSRSVRVPADAVLGDALISMSSAHPVTAHVLPDGKVSDEPWNPRPVLTAGFAAVGALLGFLLAMLTGVPALSMLALGYAGVGAAVGAVGAQFLGGQRATYEFEDRRRTFARLARSAKKGQLPAPTASIDSFAAQVDELKEEYGALLGDIVYRIEYPALFDAAEPRTATFTQLLWRWDSDREVLSPAEARTLAGELRVAFDAAKANAEALGMDHLPEPAREPARTALKALRLASDENAGKGERATALRQATKILDSLALYYLPSVDDTERIVAGKRPLALPGRRTEDD